MKALKRLQPILRLAAQQEQIKARALMQSQQKLQQYQLQLARLGEYVVDYKSKLKLEQAKSITSQRWIMFKKFLEQINTMQDKQRQAVIEVGKVMEIQRQQWHNAHARHKTLQKLAEKYKADYDKELSKQEQKMLDEITQQLSRIND
jgi:flagellar protein FliJ